MTKAMGLGAAALAVVVLLAVFIVRSRTTPESPPPAQQAAITAPQPVLPHPHRDMLEDTVPAPTAQKTEPETQIISPAVPQTAEQVFTPGTGKATLQPGKLAGTLKLGGVAQTADGRLPIEHTCYRKSQSPAMSWSGAPRDTRSFVLLFEKDEAGPDDPVNWAVYNIRADSKGLPANLPKAPALESGLMQGKNDGGSIGYAGPCIPKGRHMYQFRLFALDTVPVLPPGVEKDDLIRAMNGHIIDMAVLPVVHYYKL